MWIDSHCHLAEIGLRDLKQYESMMQRAKEKGVGRFLSVALSRQEYTFLLWRKQKGEAIDIAIGIHPLTELCRWTFTEIAELAKNSAVSAIGEIGLDYHQNPDKERQLDLYRRQILLALQVHKPIVVHCRKADGTNVAILKELHPRALLHAYGGSYESAKELQKEAVYFSFGRILAKEKAYKRRQVMKKISLDRLLIESDAPYGSEENNDVSRVADTAALLAQQRGISLEEWAEQSQKNYDHFLRGGIE